MNPLEPHSLAFTISLGTGLLIGLGAALGMGHEAHHEISHDVSHDAGHDHDHDQGHARHTNPLDMSARDVSHKAPFAVRLFGALGVGKAPLTVVLMTGLLIFGGAGMILNTAFAAVLPPALFVWFTYPAAVVVSFFLTGKIASLMGRMMPSMESYNTSNEDLIGCTGRLVLDADGSSGLVQARDHQGNVCRVRCRAEKGKLAKGSDVLVVDYDAATKLYFVEAAPLETQQQS